MGVDHSNVASGRGRNSVRVSSKKAYNHGLIILDLYHMPGGQCGTWPAFWLLGDDWPNNGEVDIIEGVNSGTTNAMTLHTNNGCSITNTGQFSGTMVTDNCYINAPGQGTNVGCSIATSNPASYGTGFNAMGGGVYATEWTSEAINIWFFPRGSVPFDIQNGSPDPSGWGMPTSQFAGGCDIDQHFISQKIVFDITFCGDWAGQVWGQDSTCAPLASTCQAFVQNNATAFIDTYWAINSLKVYQQDSSSGSSSAESTTSTTTTMTTTATITPGGSPTTSEGTSTTTVFTSTTTTFVTVPPGGTSTAEGTSTTTEFTSTTTVWTTIFPSGSGTAVAAQNTRAPAVAQAVPSTASASPAAVAQAQATAGSSGNNWGGNWGGWNGANRGNWGGGWGGRFGGH